MSALITSENPLTDGQKDLIARIIEDAGKKAVMIFNLSSPAAQRIIRRGGELQDAIFDKVRELSFELPEMPCFTTVDWLKLYKVVISPKQMAAIGGDFPWNEAVLNSPCPFNPGKMVRETHFAFVGLDTVNIMELQKLNPKETEPRFYSYAPDAWYAKQKFATKQALKLRWYLLLKDIVPGSENKTFDEQTAMLPAEYEVPSAVEETAKDFLVHKKTGTYVNSTRYARTVDLVSDGVRVLVGDCDARGVLVNVWYDGGRDGGVGVGASRKFEK